jgi:FAD/FMN-containing dehydrogenase
VAEWLVRRTFVAIRLLCALLPLAAANCVAVHLVRTAVNDRPVAQAQRAGAVDDGSRLNETAVREVVHVEADDAVAVAQIRAALTRARAGSVRVSIAGFRHSMGGQTITPDGIVLNMLGHDRMQLEGEILHVQSGAVWRDVITYLDRHGRSVAVMQSDSPFSVGGSISVNCHGWQHLHEPIAATVAAITVLLPDGEMVRSSRTENAVLFSHVLGGYGLFGVILDAELHTVPNERYREAHTETDVSSYERVFDAKVRDQPSVGMAYGRISVAPATFMREAVLTTYEREEGPLPPLRDVHASSLERLVFRGSVGSGYGKDLRWRIEKWRARSSGPLHYSRNQLLRQTIDAYVDRGDASTDILHEYFVPRGKLSASATCGTRVTGRPSETTPSSHRRRPYRNLHHPERQPVRVRHGQDRHGHVVDRGGAFGAAFGLTAVGVAVEDGVDAVAVDRLFEAAGAEEGDDLGGLAFDGGLDRGVVQHGDLLRSAQTRQGCFELQ